MTTFFVLHEGCDANVLDRVAALTGAASDRGVECVVLDSLACDYSALPRPVTGDMLYNCARGSERLETLLLDDNVATFYMRNPSVVYDVRDSTILSIVHERNGLTAPKTIHRLTSDRDLLARYVEFLGGFPIVLKAAGGTRGSGTMIVDTMPSLLSIADYLVTLGREFILRQYIPAAEIVRCTVLGSRVIATNTKPVPASDFRSNIRGGEIRAATCSHATHTLAVDAARTCNLEFAGVDILIAKDGQPFLLETNSPCDFITSQRALGIAIAERMVDHLIAKATSRPTR